MVELRAEAMNLGICSRSQAPGQNAEITTEVKTDMLDHSQIQAKTSTLRKDLVRKPRSCSTSRPKEIMLTPKKAEICLLERPRVSRSRSQSTPRFGQLSHNAFFSRHNPHPHRISHIQGIPQVQMPIGDPQSLVEPRLSLSSLSNVWKEELKELTSKVTSFSKEAEVKKKKKEETERLAQYSSQTGRLIPGYIRTMTSRAPRTSHRDSLQSKDMTPVVQDQELLILELLCQILQTDSLTAIQYWLISASPREKDLVLGLLQTAVAELIPETLISFPEEKIMTTRSTDPNNPPFLSQSLIPQRSLKQSQNGPKAKTKPASPHEKPECIGNAEVLQLCENPEDRKKKM
ncbi:protein TBATA isoform X4 [Notamacropus eugenii]|uniref:protein TBATA isoform X4 n=1 Tax=Notamacropus eugenii TaxID=9315 RepID=UPI003B67DBDE